MQAGSTIHGTGWKLTATHSWVSLHLHRSARLLFTLKLETYATQSKENRYIRVTFLHGFRFSASVKFVLRLRGSCSKFSII